MAEAKEYSKSELVEQWERIQTKTFTNWVNSHLMKRGLKIQSVQEGFVDGVNLIQLLEVISEEKFPKYETKPKLRIHKVENVGKALKFIQEHGVKLAGIGAEEIVDGNLKMTLGMIWTIILRFAIAGLSEEGLSAKEGLLLWCRRKTEPYDNVDVKDFTMSFQDGLAFCALIHRHRPDLIDYHKLTAEDKLGNLNLAFDVAKEHLDIPRLLDAEDIVNMPRPDERSIMTYVAQMYQVFSSLDKVETAGRRVAKYVNSVKTVSEMRHDYEARTRALIGAVTGKTNSLAQDPLGDDYLSAKQQISALREYKKTVRRQWISEQSDLVTLFGNIQAKLKALNQPAYQPPAGLYPADVEGQFGRLLQAENTRRNNLNENLRNILDALRKAFADPANQFYNHLQQLKSALGEDRGDLKSQLSFFQSKQAELQSLRSQLPAIQSAEHAQEAANIEENEFTDHTYDDLAFEYEQLTKNYSKKVNFIEGQIAAEEQSRNVTPEQMAEFKESFEHFDSQKAGHLSKLDFKSALSSLGIIQLDFEGNNPIFNSLFDRVSAGSGSVSFDQFVDYLVSVTADTVNSEQLKDSFTTLAGGKDFLTVQDLRVGQLNDQEIEYLTSILPPKAGIEGGYDYKAYLATL
jgi:Ca2+-binding EF-hand superfamily protein